MTHHTSRLQDTPDVLELPVILYMACPIEGHIACLNHFDRNELASHISAYHPDYHEDPEPYFDEEAQRRAKECA